MYTVATLRKYNPSKIYEIFALDVIKVNALIGIFEKNLKNPDPTSGDSIICHGQDYKGEKIVYPRGVIDKVLEDNQFDICLQPYCPHVRSSGSLSTSGGHWFCCSWQEIKRSQEPIDEIREFWCWNSGETKTNGGIYFQARVKVWEFFSNEKVF